MQFLFSPELQSNLSTTVLRPPFDLLFLLPYRDALRVEGPFGSLYSQAVVEDQYEIGLQAAFTKAPVKFTGFRQCPSVMLLYVLEGDITLESERGRKQKLEEFTCYAVYAPAGHYNVELGTGEHATVQIELPEFAVGLLLKYFEIFMLWELSEKGSPVHAVLPISGTSYKVSEIITRLLYCGLADEERILFQMGRIMDLLVLLADDLAALYKDSSGALKFTPGDIKAVQDALDLQTNYETTPMKLGELARTVNMHPKKLNAGFRMLKGKTSRALASEAMIDKARKLLLETQMTVSEIAYETGYCNSSAFIRAFKRSVGVPPSAFRK